MLTRTWVASRFGDGVEFYTKAALAQPGRFVEGPFCRTANVMLELRRVSKLFASIPAVDNVSFQARAGEITGYLGPNGSGKSTTMKMITGLLQPTPGNLFDGEPIETDLNAYKQRIGYARRASSVQSSEWPGDS